MSLGNITARLKTSFANSGRAAGTGIVADRYDEDSWPDTSSGVRVYSVTTPRGAKEQLPDEAPVTVRYMTDAERRKYCAKEG